jgi:hypothetical protein
MVYFGYTLADHSVLALGRQCAAAELVLQMYFSASISSDTVCWAGIGLSLRRPYYNQLVSWLRQA